MLIIQMLTVLLLMLVPHNAVAEDPNAAFVTKLFLEACVPNMGQSNKVRDWANEHHLTPILNPIALQVFVGKGDGGDAWGAANGDGQFVLSIRGETKACAVWARTASPNEVLNYFTKVIEGVRRPGVEVKLVTDEKAPTPFGTAHTLAYQVGGGLSASAFVFLLQTIEQPGGAFQVSMKVALGKKD